jgi:hypothetical protein
MGTFQRANFLWKMDIKFAFTQTSDFKHYERFTLIDLKFTYKQTVKGKATPLQALTGPEGFRRLRLPDFKTIGT